MASSAFWSMPDFLRDIQDADPDTAFDILKTFVDQLRADSGRLRGLFEAGMIEDARKVLHKLKGSLLQTGATGPGERCREFEREIKENPGAAWADRLNGFETDCAGVLADVEQVLARMKR